jgi:hypothetical protein
MSVISKIKAIQEKQAAESKLQEEKTNRLFAGLNAERDRLYKILKKNLMELDGETVGKYKIRIEETANDREKFLKIYVDDTHHATFWIQRNSSRCSCEGPCDCETSYWHGVKVQLQKKNGTYITYFNCTSEQDFVDDMFPDAVLKLIEDFKWRNI